MKQILIYALTFSVIVLPTLFFTMFAGKREKKAAVEREHSIWLFSLLKPFIDLLMTVGVGTFFRRVFPGRCAELQKQLNFAGLKFTSAEVCCILL